MNDKKFYNIKIYSKPKINVNGFNFFYVKHYNKIPKISSNELDDCYAILYNSAFDYYYLIHITRSKFIDEHEYACIKQLWIKSKKVNRDLIWIGFYEKYSYWFSYSIYRENTNRFVRYQGDYAYLKSIKLLLPKKTTKEQAILLYKIYLNDIKKENEK